MARLQRYTWAAPGYDVLSGEWPLYRAGRRAAVTALRLRPGDRVLDVGCGTGLSFSLLHDAVGPTGGIVGIDANAAMLARAGRRARAHGWNDVELVQADAQALDGRPLAARLGRPGRCIDAVLFAYSLSLMPHWPSAWRAVTAVARPGARVAVLDLAVPTGRAALLAPLARLACALGGSDVHAEPWTMVERHADDVTACGLRGGHLQVRAGALRPTARQPDPCEGAPP